MTLNNGDADSKTNTNQKDETTPLTHNLTSDTMMEAEIRQISEDLPSTVNCYQSHLNNSVTANNGTVVDKKGRITISSFSNPVEAIEAGILLQQKVDLCNMDRDVKEEIVIASIKIGTKAFLKKLNTQVSTSKVPLFNPSAIFGGIFISEDVHSAVNDSGKFHFQLEQSIKTTSDKKETKLYKTLFDHHEVEVQKKRITKQDVKDEDPNIVNRYKYFIAAILIPILFVVIVTLIGSYLRTPSGLYKKYSISSSLDHSIGEK